MLKCDRWITEQAGQGMLEPFQSGLVRHLDPDKRESPVLSFGCSSYGYDLRLSPQEFLIFRHVPGTVMNPKRFNPANLEPTTTSNYVLTTDANNIPIWSDSIDGGTF